MRALLSFPNPVNDRAARVVAAAVVVLSAVTLATGARWLLAVLVYGFLARVLTGPTLSPLAWTAQNVIAPRLGPPLPVPGPPKRFAQGIGAVVTTAALICGLGLGLTGVTDVLLCAMIVAAALEAAFGLCLGCRVFAVLMRAGVIPDDVCAECADIGSRLRTGEA